MWPYMDHIHVDMCGHIWLNTVSEHAVAAVVYIKQGRWQHELVSLARVVVKCLDDAWMLKTMQRPSLGKSRSKMVADVTMMVGCL